MKLGLHNMMDLLDEIHRVYETPDEDKQETVLWFASSTRMVEPVQDASVSVFNGIARDVDGDKVPFIVTHFQSNDYEQTILYNWAAQMELFE